MWGFEAERERGRGGEIDRKKESEQASEQAREREREREREKREREERERESARGRESGLSADVCSPSRRAPFWSTCHSHAGTRPSGFGGYRGTSLMETDTPSTLY